MIDAIRLLIKPNNCGRIINAKGISQNSAGLIQGSIGTIAQNPALRIGEPDNRTRIINATGLTAGGHVLKIARFLEQDLEFYRLLINAQGKYGF